jgi:hypothetical protein
VAWYDGLDLPEQVAVDLDQAGGERDASTRAVDRARKIKKSSVKEWDKDHGATMNEFVDRFKTQIGGGRMTQKQWAPIEKWARVQYYDLRGKNPEMTTVPDKLIKEKVDELVEVQSEDWARDRPRYQQIMEAERKGEPVPPRSPAKKEEEPTPAVTPPEPKNNARWPNLPERAISVDDINDPIALNHIRKLWQKAKGEDYVPTPAQLVETYNLLQQGQ